MVRCPDCHKEVDADFGMTTCLSCGAVFMVEIDGSVQESLPDSEEEPDVAFSEANAAVENDHGPLVEPTFYPSQEQDSVEQEALADDSAPEYTENFLDQLSDTPQTIGAEPIFNEQNDPLEIQRFDKATSSELSEGEYLYDVTIVGIDSADLKKEVIQALSDKRFDLPVESLRKQVHHGVLKIPNLNPVRAMLIVLKTQELDVVVDWKQKHFTQTTSATKPEVEI